MSKPSISIIVPIYNMQHCMRRCIDSLLSQTFRDYELLLIDDGSTDNSAAICDEYLDKDSRIQVYHKPNGGLSDARNYGLQHAKGKYTIFADPDDYVGEKGLDLLYITAEREQADITICDLYREDEYSRHYMSQQPSELKPEIILQELFWKIGGFTVNKLIRRDLYQRFDIQYPNGIYGCEDQYVMAQFLLHHIKVAYVPVAFYHYMYNPTSLTRHYDEGTYEMDVHILQMFTNLLKGTNAQEIAQKSKHQAIFSRAFWNGGNYYSSSLFKQRFASYRSQVMSFNEPLVVRWAMYVACSGFYKIANKFVFILFRLKRKVKNMRACIKNENKI